MDQSYEQKVRVLKAVRPRSDDAVEKMMSVIQFESTASVNCQVYTRFFQADQGPLGETLNHHGH